MEAIDQGKKPTNNQLAATKKVTQQYIPRKKEVEVGTSKQTEVATTHVDNTHDLMDHI